MKAEQLWASILQEAIQGRLVPQLESEPAVEQIGDSPKLVPFSIPGKWKWIRLGDIGRWKAGGTPSRSNSKYYENGTIPWLKTGDLTDGIIKSVEECITEEAIENSSAHINPSGAVLIAMYGATIGKLGMLEFPCATNQACCACDVDVSICDRWYLFYYLYSQRSNFISQGAGGAQPNISRTKIINHWMPLPPLEEQKRIVDVLHSLKPMIGAYEKEYKFLVSLEAEFPHKLKSAILQEAIQGRLVPQLESEPKVELQNEKESFEIPFEIPSKWKWTTLEQICLQITDGEHKTPKYQIGGVPFLSVKDISSKKLNFSNTKFVSLEDFNVIKKRCYPQKGDILLSKVGSTGIPAIVDTDKEFALFVSVALLKLNKLLVLDKFLWYLLQSPLVQKQAKENTRGIGNKNWVLKAIKATMVPLPPILEQHRIVDQLEKIFSSINSLSK